MDMARIAIVGIAFLEGLNYAVHVLLRPEPWNITSVVLGYVFWAMQLACFVRLQLGNPGAVPAIWNVLAAQGIRSAEVCGRSGRLVPVRARYSRRAGAVVLGLDHFCHWLGTPVGFGNRKLFILFAAYSALFCAMGSAHSLHELAYGAPSRLGIAPLPAAFRTPRTLLDTCACAASCAQPPLHETATRIAIAQAPARILGFVTRGGIWLRRLLARGHATGQLSYLVALLLSVPLNLAATVLLSCLTLHQTMLALFNRTTLDANSSRFDVCSGHNWRAVFGKSAWLWPVPVLGGGRRGGPEGDGMHWEESARWISQRRRKMLQRATACENSASDHRDNPGAVARPGDSDWDTARFRMSKDLSGTLAMHPSPMRSTTSLGASEGPGRWALARHHGRTGNALDVTLSLLQRLKLIARWWEKRLCCGLMTISSLRAAVRLYHSLRTPSQRTQAL